MLTNPSLHIQYFAAGVLPVVSVAIAGRMAHAIRCYGNGDLTVTMPAGQQTFGVYDRELIPGKFISIDSFTGTGVRVHWPDG
jgi:hypothetical protein